MLKIWEKNFNHEAAKFISATYLRPEDLGAEFEDEHGNKWKLLGQMENSREMPCEKLETGEIFIWERWKVSQLVKPDVHARMQKNVEYIFPSTKKARERKEKPVAQQLDLFSEMEAAASKVKILLAIYGAGETTVDVTVKVRDLYNRKENIKVTNHLGGDPCPGTAKKLTIKMKVGEETIEKVFSEKTTVKI
jgi:hypothetical protein